MFCSFIIPSNGIDLVHGNTVSHSMQDRACNVSELQPMYSELSLFACQYPSIYPSKKLAIPEYHFYAFTR